MTRINAGIPPRCLCDQHLVAEYRELPRIHPLAVKRASEGDYTSPVPRFKLGKGHMLFFVDKGVYLERRWLALIDEMRTRGFATNLIWRPWPTSSTTMLMCKDWCPSMENARELEARIEDRLLGMTDIRIASVPVNDAYEVIYGMQYAVRQDARWSSLTI